MFLADNLISLTHGFLTRRGGVSKGYFDSLNLAAMKKDTIENVRENRKRALKRLGVPEADLVVCNQVHSSRVVVVDQPWKFGIDQVPKADAMVTTRPNIVLGVLADDCVPVLLADKKSGVVGAAHAGWRGLQKGVIAEVVKTMCGQGAKIDQIVAAIGPCIHKESYEVGEDVQSAFAGLDNYFQPYTCDNSRYGQEKLVPGLDPGSQPQRTLAYVRTASEILTNPDLEVARVYISPQKYLCDLPGIAQHFLMQAGVMDVENINIDTYSHSKLFFSCRSATHLDEPTFGCQVSAIML